MSSPSRAPSYLAVLRTPHACRVFGPALLGRLSYGITPLSLVLALTGATGSYAVAGGVMALFALTVSVLAPLRAGLIDRYGPARALPPMAVAYALVLAGLAAATWRPGVPGPLLLAGLVAGLATPSAGVAVSASLVLTGTLLLVSSPTVRGPSRSPVGSRKRSRAGFGVAQPVAAALGIGVFVGSVELLMVAFARQHHQTSAVAWCVAALSTGSAVGGMVYGALPWRIPDRIRLPVLVASLALGLTLAGLSPNIQVLAVVAGTMGLFVSPALATAYLIADGAAPPGARTRAGAWVNTAVNGGSSGGTATAGLLLGRLPLGACFTAAALPIFLAAATALIIHIYIATTARGTGSDAEDAAHAAVGGAGGVVGQRAGEDQRA